MSKIKIIIVTALLLLVAVGGGIFLFRSAGAPSQSGELPVAYNLSAWLWKSPGDFDQTELGDLFSFCKKQGIRTLYLDIGTYADIMDSGDSGARAEKKDVFIGQLRTFVRTAHDSGIAVEALAGGANWSDPSHSYIPRRVLAFVLAYNAGAPVEERLTGMEFDIEPYSDASFDSVSDRGKIFSDFLKLADELARADQTAEAVPLRFTVPYWLDGESARAVPVRWNGEEKMPVFHLMDILGRVPGSSVIVLDYRDTAEGKNGSIAHAAGELAYAHANPEGAHVIIGQETGKTLPRSITFYGQTRSAVRSAIEKIRDAYRDVPELQGFAIHQIQSYQEMKE